jgi:DNA-binding SARP family transcriptional activator/tetratricopeptide (TPR) repeat protein
MRVEFRVLGPLEVFCDGIALPVSSGRQRTVLAALLLRANRVAAIDDLAEALWGSAAPPSARVATQNYVKRLRDTFGDASQRIVTQRPGYLVRVAPDELDLSVFEANLDSARTAAAAGAWEAAAEKARAALSLWRGDPLAGVPSEHLALREIPRLAEMRLNATEIGIEAALHLGQPTSVIGELRRLIASDPLRERFSALLMAALYEDGRQAEALAVYQQTRDALVTALGAEPGQELRDVHQRILAGYRPRPQQVSASAMAEPPGRSGSPALEVPRQMPAAVGCFVGRAAELARLTRLLDQAGPQPAGTVVISAVGGSAGVGKTALAVHWAHQVADRFGDGQLYVNLRGFDPSGTPAAPEAAIRGFLDALGVPPERIPPGPEAQAGLYRSLLADKRMLIVLDNAHDERQVRPLLPASPGSLVLVTSRSQLGGLAAADGARLIGLDVLTHGEAVQLLAARMGTARVAAEPAAVDQIARLCACLPLALAVAAARAATRPGFPLATLADELADIAGRLDALDAGDPGSSVRAVFSWSTRQLDDEAARVFGLLGIHPGPDITVPAAASLAALAEADARRLLRELASAHLITEHVPGRYAFHDLLRAYAAEQARHTGSQADRAAATGRVLDHYLHTAARAARLLDPAKEPVALAPPRPAAAPEQPADRGRSLAWFEAEYEVLLAAVTLAAGSGCDAHAWQLAWAMAPFLQRRGHWQEYAATQRTAVAAATRLGDTAGQALSGRLLANACTELGEHDQARGHYAGSLALYQQLGNWLGQAKVHQGLGMLANRQGRHADALAHAEQALRLYQASGDKAAVAGVLNNVGWYHGLLGDYQQARGFCRQALALCAETGDRRNEGSAWDSVGYAEHHLGNLAEAAACQLRALSIARESGDRLFEAAVLTHLGDTRYAEGDLAQGREAWQDALAIFEDIQHPDAAQVRAKLASSRRAADRR